MNRIVLACLFLCSAVTAQAASTLQTSPNAPSTQDVIAHSNLLNMDFPDAVPEEGWKEFAPDIDWEGTVEDTAELAKENGYVCNGKPEMFFAFSTEDIENKIKELIASEKADAHIIHIEDINFDFVVNKPQPIYGMLLSRGLFLCKFKK